MASYLETISNSSGLSGKIGEILAETKGDISNSVFDTLADWEQQLQHLELPEPTNVGDDFEGPPPVSIRLSDDEYARLRRDAGVLSMAAYIRLKVFGEEKSAPRRKAYMRKKTSPSSELVMIGHMLGGLGVSEIAANLNDIAKAARIGAMPVSPQLEREIQAACDAVQDMKARLITVLGVKVQ